MEESGNLNCKNYVSYSGVQLPLNLVTPIMGETLEGRITYFRGYYDEDEKLVRVEKVVYGEVEFEHQYEYYSDGRIKKVKLLDPDEDEPRVMEFD